MGDLFLYSNKAIQVEQIEILFPNPALIDPGQGQRIYIDLLFVSPHHRIQSFLRHIIGLKINDCDAVSFQQSAVHYTLQQNLLPFNTVGVPTRIVQNGELEFPQNILAGAEFPAQF